MLEGRNGEGWRIFTAELRWVVNLLQSSFVVRSLLGKRKPLSTTDTPSKVGESPFVEVLKSTASSSFLMGGAGKDSLGALRGLTMTRRQPSAGASRDGRYGANPSFHVGGACPRLEGNFSENLDFCTL